MDTNYSVLREIWFDRLRTKTFDLQMTTDLKIVLAPVVQRPNNFIRWIRHSDSVSKNYFTLNVVQDFHTLPNLAGVPNGAAPQIIRSSG